MGAASKYGNAALDDFIASPLRTINSFSRPVASGAAHFAAGAAGITLSPEAEATLAGKTTAVTGNPITPPPGAPTLPMHPSSPTPSPGDAQVPPSDSVDPNTINGVSGAAVPNAGGALRYDLPGKSPLYTDAASLNSARSMVSRPAMSADDPGMQGIQARQDAADNAALRKAQYDREVAAADATNRWASANADKVAATMAAERTAANAPKNRGLLQRQLDAQIANNNMTNAASLRGQDLTHSSTMRGQDIQLRGQDMTNATTLRGQDLDYGSKLRGAQMEVLKMQRDQANKDREYSAGRNDKDFEQSETAQKAADARIDARFVDPSTGKTDAAAATAYKQFVNNGIADEAARLAASKDPRDQAAAAKLKGRSYATLDPEDHLAMEKLWANRGAAQKANGWTPGTGNFVDSLRPKDWVPKGVDQRTFGGDHVQFANGSHASVNDLTGAGTFNLFPKTTSMQDDTIREAYANQKLRSK